MSATSRQEMGELMLTNLESNQRADTLIRQVRNNMAEVRASLSTAGSYLRLIDRQLADLESLTMASSTVIVGMQDLLDDITTMAVEAGQCLN